MFKLLGAVLLACVTGAAAQKFTGTATEFVPVPQLLNCGFIIEDFALAVLLSPEVFDLSQCKAVIAVTHQGTEVNMRVAGSCTGCC
ncbi:hypothetical protein B0H19DRAFT_1265605 [Mycena capillaripes]|nr:hypothetical protein B0H19DRAFT_1265605 [Mycena capillaripes]